MKKTFVEYVSRFFFPESTEINLGIFKVKYGEGLRKDALKVVNELKSKRVLFSSLDNELWEYVFISLKNINQLLVDLNAQLGYKGPNDLIKTIDYLIKSISAYLSDYEYAYVMFMRAPMFPQLSSAHKERNWPDLGDAAKDMICLRQVVHYALKNINEFAYNGEVVDWEEPNFHKARYWVRYAEGRKLCPTCGFNLYYSKTGNCVRCFKGTTFKLLGLYGNNDVYVVGDFNEWDISSSKMIQVEYGTFIYQISLPKGKYLYKFIVDSNWIVDSSNPVAESDNDGNINSVLVVD
jgi:hypothetical protein